MISQSTSGFLNGKLYVGKTAESDERYSGDNLDELREGVVFVSDSGIEILFRCGIGRYVPFNESHIVSENSKQIYYPYANETVVEVGSPYVDLSNMTKIKDDISLRYVTIGSNSIYIQSQVEPTAYLPNHLTIDNTIYAVISCDTSVEEDSFLGIPAQESVTIVRNEATKQACAVDSEKVDQLMDSEEPNGALQIQSPQFDRYNPVRQLLEELSKNTEI